MRGLEKYTCVRFLKRTNQEDYLNIKTGGGCASYLGMSGGKQEVTLNNRGCMGYGTIQHEMIHALGYDHMHSHADRDEFVDIMWSNINPATRDNFEKVNPELFGNFDTKYDLYSVMHYNSMAFSKNKKKTIVPKDSRYLRVMGQRMGISAGKRSFWVPFIPINHSQLLGDAKRINNMYKCKI